MENDSQGRETLEKVNKLKLNLENLQQYKGEIFSNVQVIIRNTKQLRNRQSDTTAESKKNLKLIDNIEESARRIEELFNSSDSEKPPETKAHYYKLNLRRILNFGILDIESDSSTLSVLFKGRLFDIINELVEKYIEDSTTKVPIEFRGYINRGSLEKKLYGKKVGRNRLNSHITRIRTVLVENGLTDTNFIKSLENYVRLNIDSNDVKITDIATG